jgi:hypothetical protein
MKTDANPFPGIRAFEEDESELFFGREAEVDELLRRIEARNRFLAITGPSGCGKSSLVRAGLLPALKGGLLRGAGCRWRFTGLRPGAQPLRALAAALGAALGQEVENVEQTLRRSSLGLITAVRHAWLDPTENLLIQVDQFEEIFRVNPFEKSLGSTDSDEAIAFVKLLLEAARQRDIPIYVLLVLRSDYLGECANFRDLPEALNDGLYLTPRMKRDQLQQAIEGPIGVRGGLIASQLTQRILNDVGDGGDYLVLMQHALSRTWDEWQARSSEPVGPIDTGPYQSIGGMEKALNHHAEATFRQLPTDESRETARKVFQALTEKRPYGTFRRPTTFAGLCAVTAQSSAAVRTVVSHFTAFLLSEGAAPHDIVDLAHESLIFRWQRLRHWFEEEASSAQTYVRLAVTAELYADERASLLRDAELSFTLDWFERTRPSSAWAARYHPGFEAAMQFLDLSRSHSIREREMELEAMAKQLKAKVLWPRSAIAKFLSRLGRF